MGNRNLLESSEVRVIGDHVCRKRKRGELKIPSSKRMLAVELSNAKCAKRILTFKYIFRVSPAVI